MTVQLLISQRSASAEAPSSSSRKPYSDSCPAMYSASEPLCEQPKVFSQIFCVPGTAPPQGAGEGRSPASAAGRRAPGATLTPATGAAETRSGGAEPRSSMSSMLLYAIGDLCHR